MRFHWCARGISTLRQALALAGAFLLLSVTAHAQSPAFAATVTGLLSSQTIVAKYTIGNTDLDRFGNYYLAALVNGFVYTNDGAGWAAYTNGPIPVFSSGALSNRSIDVVRPADLRSIPGAQVIAGYGLSESDLLQNKKWSVIHQVGQFFLSGAEISNGSSLPAEHACDGIGSTPALNWVNAPPGTAGYALMMTRNATSGTKWNWVLYDVPVTVAELLPNSSIGMTGVGSDQGTTGYVPACSPDANPATFQITAYALSTPPALTVPSNQVTGPLLTNAIEGKILASATLSVSVPGRPAPLPGD